MNNEGNRLIELAGGEEGLRAVVQDFYDRVFPDVMIGFFFKGLDKERLVQLELEFVLDLLGDTGRYSGRPMAEAHARHPILGGQFNRRLQILRETLADHAVPGEVQERWIEHTLSLRDQITPDKSGDCRPPRA